jgi:hypothetical protein
MKTFHYRPGMSGDTAGLGTSASDAYAIPTARQPAIYWARYQLSACKAIMPCQRFVRFALSGYTGWTKRISTLHVMALG